jgi:WD40 repeat protein
MSGFEPQGPPGDPFPEDTGPLEVCSFTDYRRGWTPIHDLAVYQSTQPSGTLYLIAVARHSSTGTEAAVEVYNAESGTHVASLPVGMPHRLAVYTVVSPPSDDPIAMAPRIASGGGDGMLRVYDGDDSSPVFDVRCSDHAIDRMLAYTDPASSQPRIITADEEGRVWVVDGQGGAPLRSIEGFGSRIIHLLSFVSDGRQRLVLGGEGGELRVYDPEAETAEAGLLHEVPTPLPPNSSALYLEMPTPHVLLVERSPEATIALYDVEAGRAGRVITTEENISGDATVYEDRRSGAWRLVTAGPGVIKVWDVESGEVMRSLRAEGDPDDSKANALVVYATAEGPMRLLAGYSHGLIRCAASINIIITTIVITTIVMTIAIITTGTEVLGDLVRGTGCGTPRRQRSCTPWRLCCSRGTGTTACTSSGCSKAPAADGACSRCPYTPM